jgi:hypothetical protein
MLSMDRCQPSAANMHLKKKLAAYIRSQLQDKRHPKHNWAKSQYADNVRHLSGSMRIAPAT